MTLGSVSFFLREKDEDASFEYGSIGGAHWLNLRCKGVGDDKIAFFLPSDEIGRLKVLRRMRDSLDQAIQVQEPVVHEYGTIKEANVGSNETKEGQPITDDDTPF